MQVKYKIPLMQRSATPFAAELHFKCAMKIAILIL